MVPSYIFFLLFLVLFAWMSDFSNSHRDVFCMWSMKRALHSFYACKIAGTIVHRLFVFTGWACPFQAISNSHWKTLATTNAFAIYTHSFLLSFSCIGTESYALSTFSHFHRHNMLFSRNIYSDICPLFQWQNETNKKKLIYNGKINFIHSVLCLILNEVKVTSIKQLFLIVSRKYSFFFFYRKFNQTLFHSIE